jgi:hypothetical protein
MSQLAMIPLTMISMFFSSCATITKIQDTETAKRHKDDLTNLGKIITQHAINQHLDWKNIYDRCHRFCKTGAYYSTEDDSIIRLTGEEVTAYLESIERIDERRMNCLNDENGKDKIYKFNRPEIFAKAATCLKAIAWDVPKPKGIDVFFFDPDNIRWLGSMALTIGELERQSNRNYITAADRPQRAILVADNESTTLTKPSPAASSKGTWYKVNENDGAVARIEGEEPVAVPGFFVMSKQEYQTFKKYLKEINKPEYQKMTDNQMTEAIATKWKSTPAKLKELYLHGTVLEQGLGPDEMKKNNKQASSAKAETKSAKPAEQDYASVIKAMLRADFPSVDVHLEDKPVFKWLFVSISLSDWMALTRENKHQLLELLVRHMKTNLGKARLKVSIGQGNQNFGDATWSQFSELPTIELP